MQIIHPQGMYNGIPPENYFIVVDDMQTQLGRGYIVYQYQPHLYPDCPINIYFTMDAQPVCRYLLFGALIARARQLRDMDMNAGARVYTCIDPAGTQVYDFYTASGLEVIGTQDEVELAMPIGNGVIPMSCTVASIPLTNRQELEAFSNRLAQNDITNITVPTLEGIMQQQNYLAIGLYQSYDLIGEALLVRQGHDAFLMGIYIVPGFRRQGMGTALLHRAMAIAAANGVTNVKTHVMSSAQPQKRFFDRFGARVTNTTMISLGLRL